MSSQRKQLELIGMGGVNYVEAAAVMDIPVGTVRSRAARGRETLRANDRALSPREAANLGFFSTPGPHQAFPACP
jgi:DNA-directed RNA polymerase specialized sigma24 family protein